MTRPLRTNISDLSMIEFPEGTIIVADTTANRRELKRLAEQGYDVATLAPSWWGSWMPWGHRQVGNYDNPLRLGRNYLMVVPPKNFREEQRTA